MLHFHCQLGDVQVNKRLCIQLLFAAERLRIQPLFAVAF